MPDSLEERHQAALAEIEEARAAETRARLAAWSVDNWATRTIYGIERKVIAASISAERAERRVAEAESFAEILADARRFRAVADVDTDQLDRLDRDERMAEPVSGWLQRQT